MTRLCSCRKEKENPLPATTSLHTVLSLILVNDARSPMIDFLVSSFNLNRPSLICIIFGSVPCMFMRNDCFSVAYSTHPLLIMSGNFQSSFHINHAFVEDGRWICWFQFKRMWLRWQALSPVLNMLLLKAYLTVKKGSNSAYSAQMKVQFSWIISGEEFSQSWIDDLPCG